MKKRRRRKQKPVSKRSRQADEEILAEWTRQLRGEGKLIDTELTFNSSGSEKISDCLLEVLGDLVNQVATEEEMGKLVKLASIAWNASLLPEQNRTDFLQSSTMQNLYVDVPPLIELLIRRKLLLFPEVRRYILDVQVTVVDDSLHVSVASADLR